MYETTRPHYDSEIDHPYQAGWSNGGLNVPTEKHKLDLAARFENSASDYSELLDAIELASIRTDQHRQTHEQMNMALLGTSESDLQEYRSNAGRPERVGEHITWFGRHATKACFYPSHNFEFKDIALELGGKRQGGDWESTHALDDMVRTIPEQLKLIEPQVEIVVREGKDLACRNYLLMPRFMLNTEGKHVYSFAVLRRRRPVADVTIPNLRPFGIYKESNVLVVMGELPEATSDFIRASHDMKTYEENNTPAANKAGEIFEAAIVSPVGSTKSVIPISAHYVMRMNRRPDDYIVRTPTYKS